MIELDSLKFSVDTSELVKAVTEVGNLQKAVSNLNKPLAENARISAKAAKESAGVAIAEEKVAQAKAKTLAAESRATAAKERAEKATDRLIKKETEQISVLERQRNIYDFMLAGYSKGQATVMAQAKAQGALTDELDRLGKTLRDQRKLMGGEPFDKSIQGLISLQNALVDMNNENRMVNEGVKLTSKQYKELSRDLQRITETAISTGKSFEEMAVQLDNHKNQYIAVATEINKLTEVEKARERNQRDQLNATRSIAAEDEKMASIMKSLNAAQADHSSLSDRAARSIANYERNLRIAGITGEKAAVKLEQYRKSVMAVQQAEKQRQIDMLSRSLAPQISDVAVSLASGMNPLTVALQQGLQIRDLIGLSGVAVEDLQKSFKTAAADMVSSLAGTASALGSLFIGALNSAGKSVIEFATKITGANFLLSKFRQGVVDLAGESSRLVKFVDIFGKIFTMGAGAMVFTAVASLVAFAVGLKNVITQENELARALNLTGASLGVNHSQTIALATGMKEMGVSTSSAMKVFTLMAKEGNFVASELKLVTKAAVDLNTYGGVAIEDTVKKFSKLKEKPVEALIELAKQTGLVSVQSIKMVSELQKQGRETEAVAAAIKLMADANSTQVERMKQDYNGFALFLIDFAKGIKNAFSDIFEDLFRKSSPTNALEQELNKINASLNSWGIGSAYKKQLEDRKVAIEREISILKTEDQRRANALAQQTKAAAEYEETQKFIAQYTSKEVTKQKELAELERRKSQMSKEQYEMVKAQIQDKYKEPKSDKEKEAEKLRKSYLKDIERINDLLEDSKQKTEGLTESQRVLLDIKSSESWNKYTESQKVEIQQMAEMAHLDELMAVAAKKRREQDEAALKAYIEVWKTRDDIMFDILAESDNLNQVLEEQTQELMLQNSMLGLTAEEQQKLLKLKKLELQYQKEIRRAREIYDPSARAEAEDAALRRYKQAVLNVETEINIERSSTLINGLTDAVVTGLFEGGKAGSKKLRDIITAELRKPITVFIQAVVSDILGLGGIGGGGIGGFANTIQQGTNLLSNFINFNSNLGSNLAFAADNLGSWLVNNTSGFMNKAGGSLMQNANLIGDIGGALGGAFSGYGISKAISGGYQTGLGNTVDILGAVASAFVGPIGGVISGAVNRLFGRKLKDMGIEGTFSGGNNFSGNSYQFYKGGLFRSNKTVREALDPSITSGLSQAYGATTQATKQMAQYLGLDTGRLSNFSSSISFSTQGMSEQQVQQKLQEVLLGVAEEQAKLLLGTFETVTTSIFGDGTISKAVSRFFTGTKTTQVWKASDFVREGETATEAMTRLYTSLKAVNSFLTNTNSALMEFSLVGADMASMLVDLLGGVENFNTVTSSYYQNFFTEQERVAKGQELLAQTFKELGIALPSTVTAYRQLVESQDLATESGRQTFASLMTLSSVFYELDTASREAVSTIVEEINRLRGVVGTSSLNGFAGTKATFLSTLAAAQAGDTMAKQSLPGLSQSLETMFAGTAGSLEDVNRFRSWLANSLSTVVPSFADGGIHEGGVRLVGENGPELEVTGPSRIFNAGDTAGMLSGGNVVEAIKVLNANLELLRAEVRADVQHNAKTAKLLDRVIPEGDSINISGTIDGGQL